MHSLDLLQEAVAAARTLGYRVRHAYLDGVGGGHCEVAGRKILFLDLAQNTVEQLGVVVDALRGDQRAAELTLSPPLEQLVGAAHPPLRQTA